MVANLSLSNLWKFDTVTFLAQLSPLHPAVQWWHALDLSISPL